VTLERLAGLVLVGVCFLLYTVHSITVMRPNDPVGYVYGGVRIAETGLPGYYDENNTQVGPYFSLNAFKVRISDTDPLFYLNYSPGLPLLVALAHILAPVAAFYVVPWISVVGVAATFSLGAVLYNQRVGLLGAILLALSPVYLRFATESWSDIPAMAFMAWGLALLVHSLQVGKTKWGLLSGFLMGYAFLVRYPTTLVLIPVAVYLFLEHRIDLLRNRVARVFVLALGLVILLILLFNESYYGGFFSTGYSSQHRPVAWPLFDVDYLLGESPMGGKNLLAILETLLAGFAFSWPLIVVGSLLVRGSRTALLAGTVATFVVFYGLYLWPPRDFCGRFLIVVFPMLCVMAGHGLDWAVLRLTGTRGRRFSLLVGLVVALALTVPGSTDALHQLRARNAGSASRVHLVQELADRTEQDSVFICSWHCDLLIVYGHRSAMNLSWVAARQSPQFDEYLTAAVDALLSRETPVYYVDDSLPSYFGDLHPREILADKYELSLWQDQNSLIPRVYAVESKQVPYGS
jgi:hypothetical protein